MFWRDTSQWGQSIMLSACWRFTSSTCATSRASLPIRSGESRFVSQPCRLLAQFGDRDNAFVYPQFSLEGRRLWIIGLAPMVSRAWSKAKYWLASCASLAVTLSLITLSCCLLGMTWDRILYFGAVVTVMSFTLNGLAAGLGVLLPQLQGKTIRPKSSAASEHACLVLSFFYILGSILLLTLGSPGLHAYAHSQHWALASVAGFSLLSVGLGWLPLRLACGNYRSLSFENP